MLIAAARGCASAIPRDADPTQRALLRVTTGAGHVRSVARVEGVLPAALIQCLDERWRATGWPTSDSDPPTLTLELELTLSDLR